MQQDWNTTPSIYSAIFAKDGGRGFSTSLPAVNASQASSRWHDPMAY